VWSRLGYGVSDYGFPFHGSHRQAIRDLAQCFHDSGHHAVSALSSPIEANGKGWGILMVAAAINWFSHCICSCLWYPTVEEKKANRQPSE
jgi:hypothetical protein